MLQGHLAGTNNPLQQHFTRKKYTGATLPGAKASIGRAKFTRSLDNLQNAHLKLWRSCISFACNTLQVLREAFSAEFREVFLILQVGIAFLLGSGSRRSAKKTE